MLVKHLDVSIALRFYIVANDVGIEHFDASMPLGTSHCDRWCWCEAPECFTPVHLLIWMKQLWFQSSQYTAKSDQQKVRFTDFRNYSFGIKIQSNTLRLNVLQKTFFELSVIWLICQQQIDKSNFAESSWRVFFFFFCFPSNFALKTDGSWHWWFFLFFLNSCSWLNCWRNQVSIFDGFRCFVPVFLCKSYIASDAITA